MKLPPMEWIDRVIRINSVTHHSNEEIVRFLIPLLTESGLKVEKQTVTEGGETFHNLLAFSHDLNTPDLLVFNTHLDTVSCGRESDWTRTHGDPFRATRVRDRIYGLGSADVKIDFLCKLWAARQAKPWKRPFALIGTYGEERGLVGVEQLFAAKKIKPRFAIVGEPSNLELIYAHKGHLVFTVAVPLDSTQSTRGPLIEKKWKGKSAHSSTPDLGVNAIRKGLTDIFKRGYGILSLRGGTDSNRVPEECVAQLLPQKTEGTVRVFHLLRFMDELSRELKKRRDSRFSPSYSTLSLNQADTEGKELRLTFDIRCLPDNDIVRLKNKLEHSVSNLECRLTDVTLNIPLKGKKDSRLMKVASSALKKCGVKAVRKTKASSTEAAVYQHAGAEAIVFGPGRSVGNVHRPNEYNSMKQMEIATRFYTTLLKIPPHEY